MQLNTHTKLTRNKNQAKINIQVVQKFTDTTSHLNAAHMRRVRLKSVHGVQSWLNIARSMGSNAGDGHELREAQDNYGIKVS